MIWWIFTSPLATSTWGNNCFISFVFRNAIMLNFNISQVAYRPFSSSKYSHFQNEAKCKTFPVKTSFLWVRIKTHFHISGFALVSLALEQRQLENGLFYDWFAWGKLTLFCWLFRVISLWVQYAGFLFFVGGGGGSGWWVEWVWIQDERLEG